MTLPNSVTDNPALVIGLVRAVLGVIVAFWPGLFTAQQQEVILVFVAAALALTAATVKSTVPKSPSVDATPASIQLPQPPPAQ